VRDVESDPTDPPAPQQGAGTAPATVHTAPAAPAARPAHTTTHATTVVEKGSFTTARCACGWFASARRSRDKSRKDAAQHEAEQAAERTTEHPAEHATGRTE
jgi:hypothetical protein